MNTITFRTFLLGVAMLVLGLSSIAGRAATVTLVADSSSVFEGDSFTVALVMNAADTPGDHPGAYSGEVTLSFDPALVQFDGFTVYNPAQLFMPATESPAGSVALGFFNAADVSVIGIYSFTALGMDGDVINFGLADSDEFFGSFFNEAPTNQPFTPEFSGTSVSIQKVPLPATLWLLISGLGLWRFSVSRPTA